MKQDETEVLIEDLNPTFLFTWKGRRIKDEKFYHCHDYLEIAFMMSGVGKYRIDEKVYDVGEGDLMLFNPGTYHQCLVTDATNSLTEFFVGASDIHFKNLPENCMPLPKEGIIVNTTGEFRQKLFKICASMEAENAICWQGRYFMMKTYLMQLILLIVKQQFTPVELKTGYAFESVNKKYVVEQIVNYFEDHYADKISLDQIAENMYLSPFYISKIFKSETGDTPIRHLINIRLEKAMELLQKGFTGSIKEVAVSVGYEDAYHFSKLFKKRYGIPPSKVSGKV
ncbi:MAG TPA: AraC family transcriptional regulator [Lachnospiraceae bacterium]|nr:AraC family transcriptional regulator [Lachnospiraceae bacterium]